VVDPCGHQHPAAGPADAHELGGRAGMVGREHRAEGGGDTVEARVGERQRRRVALDHSTSTPASAPCSRASTSNSGVTSKPTTFAPALRGGDRDVAAAPGSDVEQLRPGSISARSITSAPTAAISRAKRSQSPAAQVARARPRSSSGVAIGRR
jgi:hypothetical protein